MEIKKKKKKKDGYSHFLKYHNIVLSSSHSFVRVLLPISGYKVLLKRKEIHCKYMCDFCFFSFYINLTHPTKQNLQEDICAVTESLLSFSQCSLPLFRLKPHCQYHLWKQYIKLHYLSPPQSRNRKGALNQKRSISSLNLFER